MVQSRLAYRVRSVAGRSESRAGWSPGLRWCCRLEGSLLVSSWWLVVIIELANTKFWRGRLRDRRLRAAVRFIGRFILTQTIKLSIESADIDSAVEHRRSRVDVVAYFEF